MAKLYAELTSDKGGRVASKSDDNELVTSLYRGNKATHTIEYGINYIIIKKDGKVVYDEIPF
jgi:hypothetical protein